MTRGVYLDIPQELWDELKQKLEITTESMWTDTHVKSYLQTILTEYILNTIDE